MTGFGWLSLVVALAQTGPVYTPPGSHPYRVSSASMEPTYREGDVLMADRPRGDCGSTVPEAGDVVIFQRNRTPWVIRAVAGPGQTVQVVDGVLIIDGQAVKREKTATAAATVPGFPETIFWRETLPNGRSYMTTDFGPGLDLDNTLEVTVPTGRWFVVGDNRDNSVDSRVFGPVAESDLCGVVTKIVTDDPATAPKTEVPA
ncbi:signal peptidase I [Brevundimonas sp. Root1279]|uniref:signal peptidase I n=1 Tax=Brevundimonas sp. Root1279 TaxID=1736443 RepID=UPI0006F6DECE|nr:signal peptidase I [Brevundimonas sp. Root1279]KQW86523.1 hypothetical protein ASC65_01095 [Brevundimonas sp. Root1279]